MVAERAVRRIVGWGRYNQPCRARFSPAAIFGFMGHTEVESRRYTAEEYFALEVKSEARHDFYNCHLIERPGDMTTHNTIMGNCLMAFQQALQHSKNQVHTLGSLLVVHEDEYYTYPNLLVCGADDGAG